MAHIGYSLKKIASLIRGGTIPQISEVTNVLTPVVDIETQTAVNAKALKGGFTFERTQADPQSTSARNRYDVLEYYDNDQERFGKHGLLIEPQATNIQTQSEDFSNAQWIKGGDTVVSQDGTLSNDGTKQMWKIASADFSISANSIYNADSIVDSGQDVTYHYEAKSGDNDVIKIRTIATGGTSQDYTSTFNTLTGEWVTQNANHKNFKAKQLNNGAYRISVTITLNNTGQTAVRTHISANGGTFMYATFSQIEEGSIPTSYIPTTTTAVTRSRDTIDLDPTNFPTITSGVTVHQKWYVENITQNNTTGAFFRYLFSVGENNNNIRIYVNLGILWVTTDTGGTDRTVTYDLTQLDNTIIDFKSVFDATTNYLYINGIMVSSISRSGDNLMTNIPTNISIGKVGWASGYEANAQHIFTKIYPKALTESECRL